MDLLGIRLRKFIRFTSSVLIMVLSGMLLGQEGPRILHNFDFDWKFILNDSIEANADMYNEAKWEPVQLPHDWSILLPLDRKIGGSMGFMQGGKGWYRKTFELPADMKGKQVSIVFDGVYHQSDVYMNGHHLGFHPYGYTGFEYELTPYLKSGENEIIVQVDHSNCPSSRWYSGSGIYRHVWLKALEPVHLKTGGIWVTTQEVGDGSARILIHTEFENKSGRNLRVRVVHTVLDREGNEIKSTWSEWMVQKGESESFSSEMQIEDPELWDIDHPDLYTVVTRLEVKGRVVDEKAEKFGIRTIRFEANEGFFLNGKSVKMKGVNLHADGGLVGMAVPEGIWLRRLKKLKEFGVNAIRCAHHPPAPEFLDMCDSLGFLVIDEVYDKWRTTGWFFGYYTKYFDDWWQHDLDAMIKRDRNHPSIVLWSIGNEISEQGDTTGVAVQTAKMLQDHVHATDPTRPVTIAIAPGDLSDRAYHRNGFTEVFDVIGYNYSEPMLPAYHEMFPDAIMYVSEAFPYYNGRWNFVRDYAPDNPWYVVANHDFLFGQFLWAGIDYLGESSGWPSTGWPTGLFDICMFEKPRAAFHRSVWNDEPMVRIAVRDQSLDIDPGKDHWSWPHLAAHWNFPQYRGHIIDVETVSNCDSVGLWVNDKWMGKRATADFPNNTIKWHVPYARGEIRAIGYNDGAEAATFKLETAGKPVAVSLKPDHLRLKADGQDVVHVEIHLLDEEGRHVAHDDRELVVELTGEGEIIGLGNGDMRRTEPYRMDRTETDFGKALAIIRSTRNTGEIMLRVSGKGITASTVRLSSN